MKLPYGIFLIALAALAGGCVSIGSDGPASSGRLVPVGADAADFARARALVLAEDMDHLENSQYALREQRDVELKDGQAYYDWSAGAWNEPRLLPQERARYATGYCGLAQESQGRADRYGEMIGASEGRIGFLTAERSTAVSDADKYDAMRLVAP